MTTPKACWAADPLAASLDNAPADLMLPPKDVAALFCVSVGTLGGWRKSRRPPPYIQTGRIVRYRCGDLRGWRNSLKVEQLSTPESRAGLSPAVKMPFTASELQRIGMYEEPPKGGRRRRPPESTDWPAVALVHGIKLPERFLRDIGTIEKQPDGTTTFRADPRWIRRTLSFEEALALVRGQWPPPPLAQQ